MNRSKVDPKKEEQDRMQGILLELLKEEENKYCADCNAKTPRWAAWNLGVFICIRCAGIHRNLGVHISKVRSVNLDSWSPEQVQSMRVMGNEKARKVYEHSLPEHFRRSMSDHQMEQFIRAKYEQKRYMMKDFVYPRIDVSELPRPGQSLAKKTPVAIIRSTPAVASPTASSAGSAATAPTASVNDLLDFSMPSQPAAPASNGAASLFDDFGTMTVSQPPAASLVDPAPVASASSDFDDMFGAFVSAPSAAPVETTTVLGNDPLSMTSSIVTASSNDLMGLGVGGTTTTAISNERKSSADIMSLFGSAPAPAQIVAPGGFAAFGMQAAPSQQAQQQMNNANQFAAFDSMPVQAQAGDASGLLGLNFGGMPSQPNMMGMSMPGNSSAAFPNPFGAPSGMTGMSGMPGMFPSSPAPASQPKMTSPNSPSYSIPNKSNAFADLSLGKVMSSMSIAPSRSGVPTLPASSTNPVPAAANAGQMNFDDLLGL